MKRPLRISFLSFSLILAAWHSVAGAGQTIDRIAAVVGTEVITLSEVGHVADLLLKDPTGPIREIPQEQREPWARERALQNLIDQTILKRELEKRQIEVSPDDVDRAMLGVLRQNKMTMTVLQKELAAKGVPFREYRRQLADQVKQYKFIQEIAGSKVQVTEEEVRRAFDSSPAHDTSSFAAAAPGIRQALESQKLQEELQRYLVQARGSTYIEIKSGGSS